MRLQKKEKHITERRTVYYVRLHDEANNITAFLMSVNGIATVKARAALFSTREEAESLMKESLESGMLRMLKDCSTAEVAEDVQYMVVTWYF